ncbi:MAG: Stp1/IreP family PP2C-type Ser/Thr phosphatase [Bdellovibrionales bacterium]|nr:Stp1/IreP family PP2C-type Ser/Thr phosphatase [Bdellovibrionales bacterium]
MDQNTAEPQTKSNLNFSKQFEDKMYRCAIRTDVGKKRAQNQDNGGIFPELGLFMVADGLGGHRGGETASTLAVETISAHIKAGQAQPYWDPRSLAVSSIKQANAKIFETAKKNPQLDGMGTTAVVCLIKNATAYIAHVGDSRAYLVAKNGIWQMTRDHSLVQEKLRAGLITREQLKSDRMKNVITRSVGFESTVDVDLYEMPLDVGDSILMCSDGLSGMLDDPAILKTIHESWKSGQDVLAAVDQLIQRANENGGEDNVTAVLVTSLVKRA